MRGQGPQGVTPGCGSRGLLTFSIHPCGTHLPDAPVELKLRRGPSGTGLLLQHHILEIWRGAAKGTTTTPSTFPSRYPSLFSPMGKDTEVIHGLCAGVDQASHAPARLLGGQPGQRPPGGAVVKEQAGPLQQQLLVHAVGQQPQWHLKEPVPAQVGEPAQAGDEVTPRAAAAGTASVTGRGSCRNPPLQVPCPRGALTAWPPAG